jgi:hypothetical protein
MTDADIVRDFVTHASEVHSGGDAALAALDALVAERDGAWKVFQVVEPSLREAVKQLGAAEARVTELEAALMLYADDIPRRHDPSIARAALAKEDTDE